MIGKQLGRGYRLTALLGDGGMGAVYEAVADHLGVQRGVAVKILHPHLAGHPKAIARFRREAQACAALKHPSIVELIDVDTSEADAPFIVMELVRGSNLKEEIDVKGTLAPERAAAIGVAVLHALESAHAAGIIHRDVKPPNVLLGSNGEVKLTDFGVAKLLADHEQKLTSNSTILGTPSYMAPEQASHRAVDARTDVYSVGATLYHALSGERPFAGIRREAIINAICTLSPAPLAEKCPHLDPKLIGIVERAMAKKPEDRFSSASAMAQALLPWAGAAITTRRDDKRIIGSLTMPSAGVDGSKTEIDSHPPVMSGVTKMPLAKPGEIVFDKFRIEREIGRGGMSTVYAARHLVLDQMVALKLLIEDDSSKESNDRFLIEARTAARITGPHVCRVLDAGIAPGRCYLVMELLEGRGLERLLAERGRRPPGEAVGYMMQALEAIAQAHALGIVHRDLKPSNFFLAKGPDGTETLKVLDFGISKASVFTKRSWMTQSGSLLGTPSYMPPEQIRNTKSVDHRADIWAVGIVLYELLAGELPFHGATVAAMFQSILSGEPLPLASRFGEVPKELESVVLRCLEKDPARRYPDVAALAAALSPFSPAGAARAATVRQATTFGGGPTERDPSTTIPDGPPTMQEPQAVAVEKRRDSDATFVGSQRSRTPWLVGAIVGVVLGTATLVGAWRWRSGNLWPHTSAPAAPAVTSTPAPSTEPSTEPPPPPSAVVPSASVAPVAFVAPSASASVAAPRASATPPKRAIVPKPVRTAKPDNDDKLLDIWQ